MKRNLAFQQKLLVILVIAILSVCAGFMFISCGTGPQSKGLNPDTGQYALDFTDCTGTFCRVLLPLTEEVASNLSIDGKALTAEAWVKVKSTSTTGYIAGRVGVNGGIVMLVKNNVPKFSIRVDSSPTSTDYMAVSGVSLVQNVWTHIAGVLSTSIHSHPSSLTCAVGVGNETPHLDIYINGTFAGCATTVSQFADSPGSEAIGVGVNGESGVVIDDVPNETLFNGVIDEVRVWGVERTPTEINACMNQELGLSGNCSRMNDVAGYFRFNEGQGAVVNDWIGLGSGVKEEVSLSGLSDWELGWTTDTPNLKKTD